MKYKKKISKYQLYNRIINAVNESIIQLLFENMDNNVEITWEDGCAEFRYKDGVATLCDESRMYSRELSDDEYELVILEVPKSSRHQGIGSKILNAVINIAEQQQCNIVLYADPFNTKMTVDELISFYNLFGFVQDELCDNKQCLIYYHN